MKWNCHKIFLKEQRLQEQLLVSAEWLLSLVKHTKKGHPIRRLPPYARKVLSILDFWENDSITDTHKWAPVQCVQCLQYFTFTLASFISYLFLYLTYRYHVVMLFSVNFACEVELTYRNSLSFELIFFIIGIYSVQGWAATMRHVIGTERRRKRLKANEKAV